jgi:hypothetical protein
LLAFDFYRKEAKDGYCATFFTSFTFLSLRPSAFQGMIKSKMLTPSSTGLVPVLLIGFEESNLSIF